MVKLDEFLKFKEQRHEDRMHEIHDNEKELAAVPYIDNIPLYVVLLMIASLLVSIT